MSQSSQTESESGDSAGGDTFVEITAETGIGQLSPLLEDSETLELHEALCILQNLDICAVEHDQGCHDTIRRVSSTILVNLQQVSNLDISARRGLTLTSLLNTPFMTLLFQFRAVFHRIAAYNAEGGHTSIVVSWVDVILAKLGHAITFATGALFDVLPIAQDEPHSVRTQREDDMLHAAVQLPEKWADVVHVLCSEYVSPAAYRLALALTFGVHVMAPQLTTEPMVGDRVRGNHLAHALDARLKKIAAKRSEGIPLNSVDAREHERLAYAMFVSLYATTFGADADTETIYKPQTYAILLEMVQAILQPNSTLSPSSVISPPNSIDVPLVVLTRWGATLPWTWVTWEDGRTYNSELVDYLTAAWLHTLDSAGEIPLAHSVEYWDEDLVSALESRPRAALSMMARLLFAGLSMLRESHSTSPSTTVLDVLLKVCWSTRYLMRIVDVDHASTVALFSMLCNMFALLSEDELELGIKDLIIETLTLSAAGLQEAIKTVSAPKSEFSLQFDYALERLCKAIPSEQTSDAPTSMELRAARQVIQLITLMWTNGASLRTVSPLVHPFLAASIKCMKNASADSPIRAALGYALVGVLATLEQHRGDCVLSMLKESGYDAFVWNLVRDADPSDLPLASSLAAYVNATAHLRKRDPLLFAEAWGYFQDVLLLILTSEFEGPEEPLSLLVAPFICGAMQTLLRHSDASTKRYYVSSPWTTCLVKYLKDLRSTEGSQTEGESVAILRERIAPTAELLCEHLGSSTHTLGGLDREVQPTMTEAVFCWIRSLPCVILSQT